MGCDIHMVVEVNRNGVWERAGVKRGDTLPPRACSWCDGLGHFEGRPSDKCYSCKGTKVERGSYSDRNYTVFSVLADVRNDGNVTPIAKPRGLPSDATGSGDWEYGDHSRSWLLLSEVLAYDWNQVLEDEGYVDEATFAAWSGVGAPENWCAQVSGLSVEHVTNSKMRERIERTKKGGDLVDRIFGKRSFYALCHWTVPLRDYCKHFLAFVDSLAPLGEPSSIRLVFGFDS